MVRTKETVKEEKESYGYYSRLLQKPFDTLDELIEAEDLYKKEQIKQQEEKNEKKRLAEEVEKAYTNYFNVVEETSKQLTEFQNEINKKISDARNNYFELKNKFIDLYGQFHMTYKDKEAKVDYNDEDKPFDYFGYIFDALKSFPWKY